MKTFVVEFDLANKIPPSNEHNARAARITGKNTPAASTDERYRRAVALKEFGHATKRVPRKSKLGQHWIETRDAPGTRNRGNGVSQEKCT